MRKLGETTREFERRMLRQEKLREQMETADRLRSEGHPEAADEIERALGIVKPPPVDPKVEDAVALLEAGKAQAVLDLFLSGALTPVQAEKVISRLSPQGEATYEQAVELDSERRMANDRRRI